MELHTLTITEAQKGLREKKFSAAELLSSCLARAKKLNPKLNAYLELWEEDAKQEAAAADAAIASGDIQPLTGIPIALKDNFLITGRETTSGSKILVGHKSAYTATVVERLQKAGAVFVGRTNMDEFAMGSSTESSAFGTTRNPWDMERVPGGSSGGSAVAVAADCALGSFGSDTGGSVRQPASLCGIVGIKPTYGRVSRYGLMALASSLDQISPFAKTVRDAAILLQVVEGDDPLDSTSASLSETTVPDLLFKDIKGMRIGVPKEYFIDGMDPEVKARVCEAIKKLEALGGSVEEISLPHTEYGIAVYYIVLTSEASANLARFDGMRFGHSARGAKTARERFMQSRGEALGDEVKRRIMIGTYALSAGYYDAYYKKAQKVRTLIANDFREAFKKVDCIVTPTSPTVAFKIGEKFSDPLSLYLADIFTVSAPLAGVPGISVPCGFVEKEGKRLPVGLQFIGRHFDEATIFRAAHTYEQATEWHKQHPLLV